MRVKRLAMWAAIAASLGAQEPAPGFKWVGLRAGSMSFDPLENLKAAPVVGVQGGLLYDGQRHALAFEALSSRPDSRLVPARKVGHTQVAATLMTGLVGDAPGALWPYLGLGLGGITVSKTDPATQVIESSFTAEVHASLGLLHRPLRGVLWGAEGRYLVAFADKGRSAFQGSLLLGFTWGGRGAAPPTAAVPPPAVAAPLVPQVPSPSAAPPSPVSGALGVPRPLSSEPPAVAPPASAPEAPAPAPVPAVPASPAPPPLVVVVAPPPEPEPLRPASVPVPPARPSDPSERLAALLAEDMTEALDLGRRRVGAMPATHWTLRLEIANLPATLKHAAEAFQGAQPDLFIAPIKLKGGRTAYQLFLGEYASRAEAEAAAKRVPGFFLEDGQRPRVLQVREIPKG